MTENLKDWYFIKDVLPENFINDFKLKISLIENKLEKENIKKQRQKKFKRLFN